MDTLYVQLKANKNILKIPQKFYSLCNFDLNGHLLIKIHVRISYQL